LVADIVFIARQRKHPTFTRDGNNLILEHDVNLCDALTGHVIQIFSLDGRKFNVGVVHIIRPGYERVVANEGMPIYGETGKSSTSTILFLTLSFACHEKREIQLITPHSFSLSLLIGPL